MKCTVVHKALSAIDRTEEGYINLNHRLTSQLDEMGLTSTYSTWFYEEMLSSAAKLKRARNLWRSLEPLDERAENLKGKIKKLEAMPNPDGYKPTFDGNFVKLTEKGKLIGLHLSGRLPELEDILLEDVEIDLDELQDRIDLQYSRFIGMYNLMVKEGFKKGHNKIIDCAVRLSTIEGPVQELYERMELINDNLYNNHNLGSYNRLLPTFAVTRQSGNIETLKEKLTDTYKVLTKSYLRNFFTWWLAAEVMELERFDIEKNIECYEGVRNALKANGWERDQKHTCYMAVHLAKRHDSAEELAGEHDTLYEMLVKSGRSESKDLGTASLILLDYEGTLDERVDRFTEVFITMHSKGWEKQGNFYPAAAALTLMPGSVKENVMWLDTIISKLKSGGFADKSELKKGHKDGLTYRALPILIDAYASQFRQEVTPSIIVHSEDTLLKK